MAIHCHTGVAKFFKRNWRNQRNLPRLDPPPYTQRKERGRHLSQSQACRNLAPFRQNPDARKFLITPKANLDTDRSLRLTRKELEEGLDRIGFGTAGAHNTIFSYLITSGGPAAAGQPSCENVLLYASPIQLAWRSTAQPLLVAEVDQKGLRVGLLHPKMSCAASLVTSNCQILKFRRRCLTCLCFSFSRN